MIRQAKIDDADQIAKVRIDSWKDTYRGIVSDEFLDRLDYIKGSNKYREFLIKESLEKFIYVYEENEQILGFVWFGNSPFDSVEDKNFDGEIYAIYLQNDFKGKGIGKLLIDEALKKLKVLGCKNILIWAFKENNNARKFYERLGARLVKEKPQQVGEQYIDSVAYIIDRL